MRSSRPSPPRRLAILVVAAIVLVGAAACTNAANVGPKPTVSGAWVRLPSGAATQTAAYLTITNTGDQADALTAVSSTIAASMSLHRTTTATDGSGMTGMQPVSEINVPAGGTVTLEPGGFHMMVMGLKSPLTAGQKVQLELTFQHAGKVIVDAEVRAG